MLCSRYLPQGPAVALPLLALLLAMPSSAAPQRVAPDADRGLTSVALPGPAGTLTVYLPSDMAAGDTISGTVIAEPSGSSEAERRRNRDTLSGYVVEVDRQPLAVSGGHFRYVVPAAGVAALGLLRSAGSRRPLAEAKVPINPQSGPTAGQLELPRLGQSGRPIAIHGPFDGDMANTQVTIGDRPVEVLAESPRSAVFHCPDGPIGATTITALEGGQRAQGPFRNLELNLFAPKTMLKPGEVTRLDVQVHGLAPSGGPLVGTEVVELTLVSSGPILLQGGNVQVVVIEPAQVGGDGTFSVTREVRGVAPGPFGVQGLLLQQGGGGIKDDPLVPGAIDMNGIDGSKELLVLLSGMNDEERERRLRATLKALQQRRADAQNQAMRDWLDEKIRIVQKAMDTLGYDY
ncbi:MAG: hypothetical protein FJ191_04045 [Gammaproteobacteria bacterium]|nr:hypothetical protein [Gammaproteobacteria bacterium]